MPSHVADVTPGRRAWIFRCAGRDPGARFPNARRRSVAEGSVRPPDEHAPPSAGPRVEVAAGPPRTRLSEGDAGIRGGCGGRSPPSDVPRSISCGRDTTPCCRSASSAMTDRMPSLRFPSNTRDIAGSRALDDGARRSVTGGARLVDDLGDRARTRDGPGADSYGPGVRSTAASAVAASASRIAAPSRAFESART